LSRDRPGRGQGRRQPRSHRLYHAFPVTICLGVLAIPLPFTLMPAALRILPTYLAQLIAFLLVRIRVPSILVKATGL
jgi:hypothetical protein